MRRARLDARTLAGVLSIAAALSLAYPGVRVSRAGEASAPGPIDGAADTDGGQLVSQDEAPGSTDEAPLCSAHATAATATSIAQMIESLRDGALTAQPGDQSGSVALNSRGYNYGPAPSPIDPAQLRFEAEQQNAR
jgi:hypothetical protein